MTDTPTLFDLVGDAGRLASRIDIIAADLFGDDPEAAAAASAELEELINAQADNQEAIMAKADCWAWVILRYVSQGEARLAQARRLQDLARQDATRAEGLKARLVAALNHAFPGDTRFELPHHMLTSRRSEAVEVTCDPVKLPESCQRITIEPDRTAIKATIKAGTAVPGCELIQRRTWRLF